MTDRPKVHKTLPNEKPAIHPLYGCHFHHYTEWYKPHWWSIPQLVCRCGAKVPSLL